MQHAVCAVRVRDDVGKEFAVPKSPGGGWLVQRASLAISQQPAVQKYSRHCEVVPPADGSSLKGTIEEECALSVAGRK